MLKFVKAYVKSMRLYYAFVTGIAGWLGIVCYEYMASLPGKTIEVAPGFARKTVILVLLFLSWGINQIINDRLGLKEDRINAPERPMVTGELDPNKSVMLSIGLLLTALIVTGLYLEPLAIVPAVAGVLLNVLYEHAKGFGILGNIVFGIMIAMSYLVGFFAAGPIEFPHITSEFVAVFVLLAVINGVMTLYTYFKDYEGDKAAGKKTIVVGFGIAKSRIISVLAAFIPAAAFVVMYLAGFYKTNINNTFVFLMVISFFLQLYTGFLYYKYPEGERSYYSLAVNFRAGTCAQAALIALYNAGLGGVLFVLSYIFVGLLSNLHSNSKA